MKQQSWILESGPEYVTIIIVKKDCFCAFCKSPRSVYAEKSIRPRHFFWSFLLASAMSFLVWRTWNPKCLLFFVVAAMLAEVFVKIRWRIHVVCRNCGFDPVIYVKDPAQAARLVKVFLDRRAQDPAFLLRAPLQLPKRKPSESGTNLSLKY